MIRTLSHTELRALTICEARWDFRYGGTLAGDALDPKTSAPRLREGRAWGRAVAAWHCTQDRLGADVEAALALREALDEDADQQKTVGVYDAAEHAAMTDRLLGILAHYILTSSPLELIDPERHIDVAIPSRTGRRASSRYRFGGFLDGVHIDADGRPWIVEFKLRGELSSIEQLVLDRQGRRYAWAWWRMSGRMPAGVIYDERLYAEPKAPKINRDGRPSSDKRQLTTPEQYRAACSAAGVEPDPETAQAFAARLWQRRERIIFRPGELEQAGAELVALAQRVHELEVGRLPIREPHRALCGGCAFRGICPDPTDSELVDGLFWRVPAKRDRMEIAA